MPPQVEELESELELELESELESELELELDRAKVIRVYTNTHVPPQVEELE